MLTSKEIQKKFEELSAKHGGSLIVSKQKIDLGSEAIGFIGLGGLGSKTVNDIKAEVAARMNTTNRIKYLAIDTCLEDMEGITYPKGMLTGEETVQLYDPNNVIDFSNPDPSLSKWMNTVHFKNEKLDGKGAKGIRQIGRAFLYSHNAYSRVERKISEMVRDLKAESGDVRIYIIAGISGGTGSGSVVDVGYMLRDIVDNRLRDNLIRTEAIIYMPDVQEADRGIAGTDYVRKLRENAYAALKELNFFYNASEHHDRFEYIQPGCGVGGFSTNNIFDCITLVSRFSNSAAGMVCANSAETRRNVAKALVFQIANVGLVDNGTPVITASGAESNENAYISAAFQHARGIERFSLPPWALCKYRAFSYGSVYIPRDELLAYCANMLFEKLTDKWAKQNNLQVEEIDRTMERVGLDSVGSFVAEAYKYVVRKGFAIDKDDDVYPRKPALGIGKVANLQESFDTVMEAVKKSKRSIPVALREDNIIAKFVEPILAEVDKAFADENKGPYYAINLLSANTISYDYNRANGIMKRLAMMKNDLKGEEDRLKEQKSVIETNITELRERLGGRFSTASDEDIEKYVDYLENYGKVCAKMIILGQLSSESEAKFIDAIIEKLNEKNNRLYNIYTSLIDELTLLLASDSEYLSNTKRERQGTKETFTFDVANFDPNDPVSNRFKDFFASLVDNAVIEAHSKRFIDDVILKLKKYDTEAEIKPEQIVDAIRDFFEVFFGELCKDTIEKLCVIAYNDTYNGKKLTPEELTVIWNDIDARKTVLGKTAQKLADALQSKSKIMLKSAGMAFDAFPNYTVNSFLNQTPNLNAEMQLAMGSAGNSGAIGKGWSEYIRMRIMFGIPLYLVDGLEEAKRAYIDAKGKPGMHLNEVDENWKYMPEPIGYIAANQLNRMDLSIHDRDKEILDIIWTNSKRALDYGIIRSGAQMHKDPNMILDDCDGGKVENSADQYYIISRPAVAAMSVEELKKSSFADAVMEQAEEGKVDMVGALCADGQTTFKKPVPIRWKVHPLINLFPFATEDSGIGTKENLGNVVHLIRDSFFLQSRAMKALASYDVYMTAVDELISAEEAHAGYEQDAKNFIRALQFGAVTYSAEKKCWYYMALNESEAEKRPLFNARIAETLDAEFALYNAFRAYGNLPKDVRRRVDSSVESAAQKEKTSGIVMKTDCTYVYDEIIRVLSNEEYLANDYDQGKRKLFKEGLSMSEYSYDLPNPIEKDKQTSTKGISTVIENLEMFYRKMKTARWII